MAHLAQLHRLTPGQLPAWRAAEEVALADRLTVPGLRTQEQAADRARALLAEVVDPRTEGGVWQVRVGDGTLGTFWLSTSGGGKRVASCEAPVLPDSEALRRSLLAAAEDAARGLGAERLEWRLVNAPTSTTRWLVAGGYRATSTRLRRTLTGSDATASLDLRSMTEQEFRRFAAHSTTGFAGELAAASGLPAADALRQAERALDEMLPDGRETIGHHFWTAHDRDLDVGHLWASLDPSADPPAAFVLDLEVPPGLRGSGYGRRIMESGHDRLYALGARWVALNVFADNDAARRLYDSLGYLPVEVTMQRGL